MPSVADFMSAEALTDIQIVIPEQKQGSDAIFTWKVNIKIFRAFRTETKIGIFHPLTGLNESNILKFYI